MIRRCCLPWLVLSPLISAQTFAQGTKLEATFAQRSTVWATPAGLQPPKYISTARGEGYQFTCDFTKASPVYPVCAWTASFGPDDLSGVASIAFRLHIRGADAVHAIGVYFKSGDGWYILTRVSWLREGWNEVVLHLENTEETEGKPAGWNRVDGLRFNVFPTGKSPAVLQLVGMRTSAVRLPLRPLFFVPAADRHLLRPNQRAAAGHLLQSRVILNEEGNWITQQDRLIDRIARAGFNVLMPCVWHGRGALFRSKTTAVEPRFRRYFAGGRDPFAELIRKCHARGIQVQAWFCVSYPRGKPDPHPEFATKGVPSGTYDLQDPAVRKWIANEIVECARNYYIDGVCWTKYGPMGSLTVPWRRQRTGRGSA